MFNIASGENTFDNDSLQPKYYFEYQREIMLSTNF